MNEELQKTVEVLNRGGLILYPTDTVWGIGCDATNTKSVEKVYALKKRTDAKAMITLVASEIMLERTVIDIPEIAWDLIETAEKPLTIIYEKGKRHSEKCYGNRWIVCNSIAQRRVLQKINPSFWKTNYINFCKHKWNAYCPVISSY